MHYWAWILRMIWTIILLRACMYHYTNYPEEIHKLSFHLCKVIFTVTLHFKALLLCPCFLQLHGLYWQEGSKHTKPVLSGGLPWLIDLTTWAAGNNFWLSSVENNGKKLQQRVILVRVSTWILKTAVPKFIYWREIYIQDTLQITCKDVTLWRDSKLLLRFKQWACPDRPATSIQWLHGQYLHQ